MARRSTGAPLRTRCSPRRLLLLGLLPWLLSGGCARDDTPRNLFLVTIDTLRADHLSFYGYERQTTPQLAERLDDFAVFEHCYSPLPLTDPSLSSIMTGQYPVRHRVRNTGRKLPSDPSTLAELLAAQDYDTAAFVSRSGLVGDGHLDRGFAVANFEAGDDPSLPRPARAAERSQRRAVDVTDRALAWLEARGDAPFFLWLHYFDPHAFYDPPSPFRDQFAATAQPQPVEGLRVWWGEPRDVGELRARYDEEILTADHHLARVIDALRARGMWDSTLFVLTSDHGESLGEHGHMDHGEWLYQEQVRVPLLMRLPGRIRGGEPIPDLVRLIDLAPSVLELLQPPSPERTELQDEMDGESFVPVFSGAKLRPRRAFIESEDCASNQFAAPGMICDPPGFAGKLRAVFDGRWKLIVTPRKAGRVRELYDLETDPEEQRNLARREPARVRSLEAVIDRFWSNDAKAPARPHVAPRVNEGEMERLRALGYAD